MDAARVMASEGIGKNEIALKFGASFSTTYGAPKDK